MGAKNHDISNGTWLAHPTDATPVANDLIQINALVSKQRYYELAFGVLVKQVHSFVGNGVTPVSVRQRRPSFLRCTNIVALLSPSE